MPDKALGGAIGQGLGEGGQRGSIVPTRPVLRWRAEGAEVRGGGRPVATILAVHKDTLQLEVLSHLLRQDGHRVHATAEPDRYGSGWGRSLEPGMGILSRGPRTHANAISDYVSSLVIILQVLYWGILDRKGIRCDSSC